MKYYISSRIEYKLLVENSNILIYNTDNLYLRVRILFFSNYILFNLLFK